MFNGRFVFHRIKDPPGTPSDTPSWSYGPALCPTPCPSNAITNARPNERQCTDNARQLDGSRRPAPLTPLTPPHRPHYLHHLHYLHYLHRKTLLPSNGTAAGQQLKTEGKAAQNRRRPNPRAA